jgi:hypothetical protein
MQKVGVGFHTDASVADVEIGDHQGNDMAPLSSIRVYSRNLSAIVLGDG